MHLCKATKAIILIINHVTAVLIPPHLNLYSKIHDRKRDNDGDLLTQVTNPATTSHHHLLTRDSCPQCRSKCSANRFISPDDCRKCLPCPPSMKPDITWRICIPGVGDDDESKEKEEEHQERQRQRREEEERGVEEERKEKEREKDMEKKKLDGEADAKKKEEDARIDPEKEKKVQKKKEPKKSDYLKDKERAREENLKRNKVRRLARCLPLVVISMGAYFAAEYAEEFFDEDYLESLELLTLWPLRDTLLDVSSSSGPTMSRSSFYPRTQACSASIVFPSY